MKIYAGTIKSNSVKIDMNFITGSKINQIYNNLQIIVSSHLNQNKKDIVPKYR